MNASTLYDPKGLIREAFAIDGINAPECRSIFLDWALSLPTERDAMAEIGMLIAHYGPLHQSSHPMIETLREAQQKPQTPRRRGGRQGRLSS